MIVQRVESETVRCAGEPASLLDGVRLAVATLAEQGHGTIAICDALVTVAAVMMDAKVGRAGAALWLKDVFDDVRLRRGPHSEAARHAAPAPSPPGPARTPAPCSERALPHDPAACR